MQYLMFSGAINIADLNYSRVTISFTSFQIWIGRMGWIQLLICFLRSTSFESGIVNVNKVREKIVSPAILAKVQGNLGLRPGDVVS